VGKYGNWRCNEKADNDIDSYDGGGTAVILGGVQRFQPKKSS
jgi:hypothetical protein